METIAVYWEPVIKTYGFMEQTGLSLFRFSCPVDRMTDWGQRLREWATAGDGFIMVAGSGLDGQTLQFNLLFEQKGCDRFRAVLEKWTEEEPRMSLQVENPVELIYFHGPHYGDRYGIASAALEALAAQAVPVLAMACTGASVYLIMPEGKARSARKALEQAFLTPETENPPLLK